VAEHVLCLGRSLQHGVFCIGAHEPIVNQWRFLLGDRNLEEPQFLESEKW